MINFVAMKKIGHIFIVGRIGNQVDENGNITERGMTLIDVIVAARSHTDAEELHVQIHTPGGNVDVSDDIFNYLVSLKSTKKIITSAYPDPKTKRGLIASAGVKIFLAGDERRLRKSADDLFVHYPRMNPGVSDAARLAAAAEATSKVEQRLINDYASLTGNTAEALSPLMRKETALSGEEALQLGFATSLVDDVQSVEAILNLNKTNPMTFKEQVLGIVADLKKLVVAEGGPVEYKLASGKVLVTDATDATKVVGASATIDGQPAPDGEHVDSDGNTIVVAAGKVTELKPKAADDPAAAAPPVNATIEARMKTLEDNQSAIMEALKAIQQATVTALKPVEGAITKKDLTDFQTSIRSEIKTGHRIPEMKTDDIVALSKAWDESMQNNTNGKIKREDRAKWEQMYFARYKKAPSH